MALRHRQWVWMWGSRRSRIHEVRLMVRRGATSLDSGDPEATMHCAMAKRLATDGSFQHVDLPADSPRVGLLAHREGDLRLPDMG